MDSQQSTLDTRPKSMACLRSTFEIKNVLKSSSFHNLPLWIEIYLFLQFNIMCYLNRRVKNMCKNKKKIMERKQNYEGIILFLKVILKIIHVLNIINMKFWL